jgi:hypothetical protein
LQKGDLRFGRGGLHARKPIVEPFSQHRFGKTSILRSVLFRLHEEIHYAGRALVLARDSSSFLGVSVLTGASNLKGR